MISGQVDGQLIIDAVISPQAAQPADFVLQPNHILPGAVAFLGEDFLQIEARLVVVSFDLNAFPWGSRKNGEIPHPEVEADASRRWRRGRRRAHFEYLPASVPQILRGSGGPLRREGWVGVFRQCLRRGLGKGGLGQGLSQLHGFVVGFRSSHQEAHEAEDQRHADEENHYRQAAEAAYFETSATIFAFG